MFDRAKHDAIIGRIRTIPIVVSLQLRIEESDDGYCKMTMPRDPGLDGIYQSVHGGLLMTAADSAACFAIMTKTGPNEVLTTTDMNIRFLARCLSDVTVEARVIKIGRTLCPVATELFDSDGIAVAVAQVTYMRLDKIPGRS